MSLSRRRVRRVIRRIEPWSVLRFSIVFYACLLVILIVAGAALWIVASIVGVVHNAEKFIGELFLLDNFRFLPFQILRATAIAGVLRLRGSGGVPPQGGGWRELAGPDLR